MKLKQEKGEFMPITITLETREEANALSVFTEEGHMEFDAGSPERCIAIKIANALGELDL